jgi:hypothetical protein
LVKKDLRAILNNLEDTYLNEILAKIKYYLLGSNAEIDQEFSDKLAELELIATQIVGDKRVAMLDYFKELELLETEKRKDKMSKEFALADDDDDEKLAILSGAIKAMSKNITLLKRAGQNNNFAGLFEVWEGRKST